MTSHAHRAFGARSRARCSWRRRHTVVFSPRRKGGAAVLFSPRRNGVAVDRSSCVTRSSSLGVAWCMIPSAVVHVFRDGRYRVAYLVVDEQLDPDAEGRPPRQHSLDSISSDSIRYDCIRYDSIRFDSIRFDWGCRGQFSQVRSGSIRFSHVLASRSPRLRFLFLRDAHVTACRTASAGPSSSYGTYNMMQCDAMDWECNNVM